SANKTEPWVLRIPCRRISASNKCVTTRVTRRRLKHTQFLRSEKSKSWDMVCGYAHQSVHVQPIMFFLVAPVSLADAMGDLLGSVQTGQHKKSLSSYGRD